MRTLTAQMSNTGRAWHLYVVLYGETEWPTFRWDRTAPVPTGAERRAALASLGYEVAPGAVWSRPLPSILLFRGRKNSAIGVP